MDFPENRAELYKDAIDALLRKWDASKNIKRDEIYRHLSIKRKESLLCRIAAVAFEKEQYFFPQIQLEKQIGSFLLNLPEANERTVSIDSEAVLKAIESQHGLFVERAKGIYSFCHLTFQEYFTAQYIVFNAGKGALRRLVENHIFHQDWREVFILTAGMLDEADELLVLMKNKIDYMMMDLSCDIVPRFINLLKNNLFENKVPLRSIKIITCLEDAIKQIFKNLESFVDSVESPMFDATFTDGFWMNATSAAASIIDDGLAILNNLGIESTSQIKLKIDSEFIKPIEWPSFFDKLSRFFRANEFLVACLNTECYVSRNTREKIIAHLFEVGTP